MIGSVCVSGYVFIYFELRFLVQCSFSQASAVTSREHGL